MTNKQTIKVQMDVPFTNQDIEDNIVGSGFLEYEWWVYLERVPEGYCITAENPEDEGNLVKAVTFDAIRRIMGNLLAVPECYGGMRNVPHTFLGQFHRGLTNAYDWDFDSWGADELMQIAVFGQIYYS